MKTMIAIEMDWNNLILTIYEIHSKMIGDRVTVTQKTQYQWQQIYIPERKYNGCENALWLHVAIATIYIGRQKLIRTFL